MLAPRVEIGAVFRQQPLRLQLPFERCETDERESSSWIRIGPEIKKLLDGRRARDGIIRERGDSGLRKILQRKTSVDEERERLRVIAVCDSQQFDLLSGGALRVGAARKQQPHGLDVAAPRRRNQCRRAVSHCGVDRGAAIEQQTHRRRISGGPHERRRAALACRVDVRAAIEHDADDVRGGKGSGLHQRRGADVIAHVRVRRALERRPDGANVVGADRVEQRPIGCVHDQDECEAC